MLDKIQGYVGSDLPLEINGECRTGLGSGIQTNGLSFAHMKHIHNGSAGPGVVG